MATAKLKTDLAALQAAALAVAHEEEEHRRAIAEERDAEAEMLESVIEVVKPALKALGSRLAKKGSEIMDTEERFEESGFVIAMLRYDFLALLTDGRLAHLVDKYPVDAPDLDRTLKVVTARQAMEFFELDECIASIEKKLNEQRGTRRPKSASAKKRAAELREMARAHKKPAT